MKLFSLLLLVLFTFTNTLCAQATRSFNETISATDVTTIQLNLDSENIDIRETKGSRVIIEAHITLEGIDNTTLLEFLISSGRYNLENRMDATTSTLVINQKKEKNVLLVKGQECKEKIRYVILVPSTVKFVKTNNSTTASK